MQLALNTYSFARLPLIPHINFAGRVLTNQHRRQAGYHAIVLNELNYFLRQFRTDLLRQLLAIENSRVHGAVRKRTWSLKYRCMRTPCNGIRRDCDSIPTAREPTVIS